MTAALGPGGRRQAAEALVVLGWELEARRPGTGPLLDDGLVTGLKAKIIVAELSVLSGENAGVPRV